MGKDYLEINLHNVDEKVKFSSNSRSNPEIIVDYFPPIGTGEGYTSLELLLISLATCISSTLLSFLRWKMDKHITALKVSARGTLRDEHPKALSHIRLDMTLESQDAGEEDVKTALAIAERTLCPVWSMLKGNVEIDVNFTIAAGIGDSIDMA